MTPTAPDDGSARTLALAATLVVLGVVLTVFYGLTAQFGGTPWLVGYVALAFAAATLLARRAPTRVGLLGAAVVLAVGLLGYVVFLPPQYYGLFTAEAFADDLTGWLTGRSVVLMLEADLWAVSVAPAPVFLVWYLALQGRYDGAALAAGAALGFFVLTGDLDGPTTLVGMAGLLGLVGVGAVDTSDGGWRQLQELGLVVGLAMLLTRVVQVVPASTTGGLPGNGGGGTQSLEQELLSSPDRMQVGGRPSMSPTPRFTVRAEQSAYWHTRSFDYYTGQGWRRTDRAPGADQPLDPPPSDGTTLDQSFTVESPTGSMPAAWKPVLLDSAARSLGRMSDAGNLEPSAALDAGATYEVVSEVPSWTEGDLAAADGEYAQAVDERYAQLPDDLPERLVEKTDEITLDAEGPYETALAVQNWLTEHKRYSLGVERENWDIADAFVFALDAGYCVYFATTMAVMVRTQGVPARFTVGYAPGEHVEGDEWLVRGYHAHAWVEVYFEEVGWVTFDPTPATPRQQAQRREREQARAAGDIPTADTTRTGTATPSPTPTRTPTVDPESTANRSTDSNGTFSQIDVQGNPVPGQAAGDDVVADGSTEPSRQLPGAVQASNGTATATTTATDRGSGRDRLWMLGALATVAFGSIRLGYAQSALRSVWVRWQPRSDDPDADVERALERMEYHLSSEFRPREEGETRQQYLASLRDDHFQRLDGRTWRVLDVYQQSRYGEGVDRETADDAIRLVDELVRG